MSEELVWSPQGTLRRADGRRFDGWDWRWTEGIAVESGEVLVPAEAVRRLMRAGARRIPVGVIGPRQATPAQEATAEALGRALGDLGLPVLCGGKGGVMTAVARGAEGAGGLSIGLLPEGDWRAANHHIAIPIATGIGKARNVLIAQASCALIAVGGQYGTLSEIAFGLHFDKPVFVLEDAPDVPGTRRLPSVEAVCEALAAHLLGLSREVHARGLSKPVDSAARG